MCCNYSEKVFLEKMKTGSMLCVVSSVARQARGELLHGISPKAGDVWQGIMALIVDLETAALQA